VNITSNIFYRVLTGFFSNCGGDFTYQNNLFVVRTAQFHAHDITSMLNTLHYLTWPHPKLSRFCIALYTHAMFGLGETYFRKFNS
jgi:uncharacterized membrane protein